MQLCTQTETLFKNFEPKEATKLLADAGFDLLDLSLFDMLQDSHPFNKDGYRALAEEYKSYAEANGLRYYQAHAPFPSARPGHKVYNRRMFTKIVRAMEVASIAGAEVIIVHPVAFDDKEEQKRWNLSFYRKLLVYAEEFDIKIAIENMWGIDKKRDYIIANVMSYGHELAEYWDELNSPWLTVCLDVGHSGLVGENAEDAIRAIGHERLGALHIHDNDHKHDSHMLPFLGSINWPEVCKALGEIDYQGVFTMEADAFLNQFPASEMLNASRFMAQTARSLMAQVDEARPTSA